MYCFRYVYFIQAYVILASLIVQTVKNLPITQETQVQSLGQEDPLEKGTAIHSSIAWRIPWTEEPVAYSPQGCKEADTTEWLTHTHTHTHETLRSTRVSNPWDCLFDPRITSVGIVLVFVCSEIFPLFLRLISRWIPLWSENVPYDFDSLKFAELCFMARVWSALLCALCVLLLPDVLWGLTRSGWLMLF